MASISAQRPVLSVVTTTDRPAGLDLSLRSLLCQTQRNWEWIVSLSGGARWRPAVSDPRIRLVIDDRVAPGVASQRMTCAVVLGDLVVELDVGHELLPDALETIQSRLDARPDLAMVVGGSCLRMADADWLSVRYDPALGWSSDTVELAGGELIAITDLPATPHNVSHPRYVPDHVLAYRRSAYEEIGGYSTTSASTARHDLVCRMYQHAGIEPIGRPVYLEAPGDGAVSADNDAEVLTSYQRHLEPNALAWCERNRLAAIDIGVTEDRPEGYSPLTGEDGTRVTAASLADGSALPPDSVGLIRAYDALPRVRDKVAFFNEAYRVLAHGGVLMTLTPSSDGRGAFQDPAHVTYYNENSFWYFTDNDLRRFVPQIECRFLAAELFTLYPSEWHEAHHISYVRATLVALKDGPRQGGRVAI